MEVTATAQAGRHRRVEQPHTDKERDAKVPAATHVTGERASAEQSNAARVRAQSSDEAARKQKLLGVTVPDPAAVPRKGPPTAEELGFDKKTIQGRAKADELRRVVEHYSKPEIRDDVRERVWADLRRDPNKATVIAGLIDSARKPDPEKWHKDVTRSIIDKLKRPATGR